MAAFNNIYKLEKGSFDELRVECEQALHSLETFTEKHPNYQYTFYTRFEDDKWRCDINVKTNEENETEPS
jgi:hypothetical protein